MGGTAATAPPSHSHHLESPLCEMALGVDATALVVFVPKWLWE